LPDLSHLYQYDEALHAFAKRHAEYVANDSVVAGEYSRDLARAYLDLLEKRGLPPKLKCYPSIQLATGEYFDFLNPDATPISPEAMAHSLSKVARCNGHTTGELSVSVAQHCVLSCRAAPNGFKFEALMHDAAECVTGDITTPLKQLLSDFIRIEKNIEFSIRSQYLLPLDMTKDAKAVDLRMAATEKRDVMPKDPEGDEWETIKGIVPYDMLIDPWEPGVAKARWLDAFNTLWPAHKALKEAEDKAVLARATFRDLQIGSPDGAMA
jgi:hypothetical protein